MTTRDGRATTWALLGLVTLSGCGGGSNAGGGGGGGTTAAAPAGPAWQPNLAAFGNLAPERAILSGRAKLRPPAGANLEEAAGLRDAAAAFVDGPNRLEVTTDGGVPARVTLAQFAGTTRTMHESTSDLQGVTTEPVEMGSVNGVAFARFRYQGTSDEKPMRGVYMLARPKDGGPIWQVVAEATPEKIAEYEAAATDRAAATLTDRRPPPPEQSADEPPTRPPLPDDPCAGARRPRGRRSGPAVPGGDRRRRLAGAGRVEAGLAILRRR